MANACRRRNFLARVGINGVWFSNVVDVKEGLTRVFQRLYLKQGIGGLVSLVWALWCRGSRMLGASMTNSPKNNKQEKQCDCY